MDLGGVYRETRLRLSDLARANSELISSTLPACPAWTVKDVLGHLAGTCTDILNGNLEGVTTEPWTSAQVEARRDRPLEEILEEWSASAAQVEELVPMFPGDSATQWIADVATHEQDVRGALKKPGARDSTSIQVAVNFFGKHFLQGAEHMGLDGLRVRVEDHEWQTGNGGIQTTLEAEPFEFARAIAGRRSLEQIRAMNWDGDPEPYLKAFEWGPFRPADSDIIE